MFAVITCLQQHDLRFLAWAVLICVVSVAGSLNGYRRAMITRGPLRLAWVTIIAFMLGAGVWATHFMAMLAYQREMQVSFGTGMTALSLLAAMIGFGGGFGVALIGPNRMTRLAGGAICGGGIGLMHFTGVAAMRLPAEIVWSPTLVTAALAIGVCCASAAFLAAGDLKTLRRGVAAALLLILAICGLHFTAMGAVTLTPSLAVYAQHGLYGRDQLAIGVGVLTGMILIGGAGMLVIARISTRSTLSTLRSALDRAPSAFAVFDRKEQLKFWNESYAQVLSLYGMTAAIDLPFRDIVDTAARGMPEDVTASTLRGGGAVARAVLDNVVTPDGRCFQAEIGSTQDGGFVVVMTDITKQREVTRLEAEARRQAEDANRAKSEFLANMSHEIRTPLNGVLGMVQVMRRGDLSSEQRRSLEVIGTAGHALLSVLNSILDLSKIEAGKLELETHPFDLEEAVKLAVDAYAPLAAQKDVIFTVDIQPKALGAWMGDAGRLRQVLSNLASNAVKFTNDGRIDLRVQPTPEGLRFEVADTGLGIPADKLELIFEKFTQADASTTRRFGGTGLGLAISRQFVSLMGGELTVTSESGVGSTFAFTLPLSRSAAPLTEPAPATASIPGPAENALRILLADDNPTNQLILEALLEPMGVQLTTVSDGRQAVAAFAPGRFDLVLMDVQMPEMNGVEATVEIRKREQAAGAKATPVIALTANVMRHQIEGYLHAGMDEVVAKPIEAAVLFRAMEAALPPVRIEDAA